MFGKALSDHWLGVAEGLAFSPRLPPRRFTDGWRALATADALSDSSQFALAEGHVVLAICQSSAPARARAHSLEPKRGASGALPGGGGGRAGAMP